MISPALSEEMLRELARLERYRSRQIRGEPLSDAELERRSRFMGPPDIRNRKRDKVRCLARQEARAAGRRYAVKPYPAFDERNGEEIVQSLREGGHDLAEALRYENENQVRPDVVLALERAIESKEK